MIGSYTRKLIIALYAKQGVWSATAEFLPPAEIEALRPIAERERALHLTSAKDKRAPCTCAGCLFPKEKKL